MLPVIAGILPASRPGIEKCNVGLVKRNLPTLIYSIKGPRTLLSLRVISNHDIVAPNHKSQISAHFGGKTHASRSTPPMPRFALPALSLCLVSCFARADAFHNAPCPRPASPARSPGLRITTATAAKGIFFPPVFQSASERTRQLTFLPFSLMWPPQVSICGPLLATL